jgi:hypothetical protein
MDSVKKLIRYERRYVDPGILELNALLERKKNAQLFI